MPARRREGRPRVSPQRESARSDGVRRCPQCRKITLAFASNVAVIVKPTLSDRRSDTDEDRKLRLHYKPAWLCRNEKCGYVRMARESAKLKA
jgi:hypothetical protein